MSTLTLSSLFSHCEENPGITKFRHPIVVWCHIAYIALLCFVYIFFTQKTFGQNLYFGTTIALYISSACYHAWKPNSFLRIIDQIMISDYIMVIPMAFLYDQHYAVEIFSSLMTATVIYKIFEPEKNWTTGAWIFLITGIFSGLALLFIALPVIGVSIISQIGCWVLLALICFIGKLIIYQFRKLSFVPNIWESEESGHLVLACGVTIITYIVITYPV